MIKRLSLAVCLSLLAVSVADAGRMYITARGVVRERTCLRPVFGRVVGYVQPIKDEGEAEPEAKPEDAHVPKNACHWCKPKVVGRYEIVRFR